ncbi:hypothetical protein JB92DRAFT_1161153 [Gautieria morchelliformis]|nr:hypothetical protein JB92DRAFT_1161153 [Gautieria morchelliformis]
MEHENEGNPYFYQHGDGPYTAMPYAPYEVPQNPEMLHMRDLSIMTHPGYPQQPPVYPTGPGSPTRVAASMQLPPSPSPVDSAAFEHPISPPVSGSDASTDSQTHFGSHGHGSQGHGHSFSRESSSGAGSPPSGIRSTGLVHRTAHHRYHAAGPAPRTRRRRSFANDDDGFSDDGEHDAGGSGVGLSPQSTSGMSGHVLAETLANSRKEATRRQRIEAEQRRRDELRDGYSRLKDILPLSNQKSSKVSLLERATNYIANLDQSSKILHARVTALEAQVARLSEINERLSLTVAHHTGHMPTELDLGLPPLPPPQGHFDEHETEPDVEQRLEQRPLSPPPDVHPPSMQQQQHQGHPQQHHPQDALYHRHSDSSASASQASGSEY